MKLSKKKFTSIRTSILKEWQLSPSNLALFLLIGCFISCVSEESEDVSEPPSLMGRGYGINSTTLAVQNLDSTLNHYTELLGFKVPGAEEIEEGIFEGTTSAAIRFPDNSFLEVLSVVDSVMVTGKDSFVRESLKQNEGVRMYSLSSSSVDSTHAWLSSQEFKMDSVRSYRKANRFPRDGVWYDDGLQELHVGFEGMYLSTHLPEFVEFTDFPYERMHEWKSYYNMQRGFIKHPNGVVGIATLQLVVDDLEAARKEYQKMGLRELTENTSKNLVRFRLKRNQELHIMTPEASDDERAEFLTDRGSGVFAITFEVKNLQATSDFLREKLPKKAFLLNSLSNRLTVLQEYAHGVQLEFEQEPKEQALLAQQLNLNFGSKLDSTAQMNAEGMYMKYCALCHGENREGYTNDFAPSLRSRSLMATAQSSNFLRYAVQFGRPGTAMDGYYQEQGGPLEIIEIELLLKWLYESSGTEEPIELSREPVTGDVEKGAALYAKHCSSCHGENGEGITAPALGNPMLLATATDEFLRYAISEGRGGTPMPAFKDSLSAIEIDGVTAFLRSRASGWNVPKGSTVTMPLPEDYVLNPTGKAANFDLREGRYVSSKQLNMALKDSMRMVILDARSTVAWRQAHIPGAVPVPYYEEPETFVKNIPNDNTWIVAYCACPHAASGKVINTLEQHGFKNTAILDEGILFWTQQGYPIQYGQ